jgi:large subunit ribosomal protein L31
MKKDIHPEYRPVIFHDDSSGASFLISSAIRAKETGVYEGKEYPMVHVEISSASHPFYTGTEKVVDTAGRVERFKVRAAKSSKSKK